MKRWHEEIHLMLRRWAIEKEKHFPTQTPLSCMMVEDEDCHCLRGPGFMRKRRPYGCGNTRCLLCHYGKYGKQEDIDAHRGLKGRGRTNRNYRALQWEKRASGGLRWKVSPSLWSG